VCGKCVSKSGWKPMQMHPSETGAMTRTNARCPHCHAFERQRVAALVERNVPTLFPLWHMRKYVLAMEVHAMAKHKKTTSGGIADVEENLNLNLERRQQRRMMAKRPKVAYFGPDAAHERALRQSGVDVHGLDFFATGYVYNANTTRKADLSGKSCGGGWVSGNNAGFKPEECVPLADQSVDGVIILHVLEHVLPLDPALEQLARVAKPGAWMQVEVPCEPEMSTHSCRASYNVPKIPGSSGACNQADHLIAYKCDDFKGLIERSGWSCVTSWEAMGRPDEWVMHKYGIYDSVIAETQRPEYWVTEHGKRQFVCTRMPSAAGTKR
jgi:SAM-dependent methyltransferase